MSPLERRCRLLLRAYPAAYRHDRGEEILGTLLETAQAGRSWPGFRDVRSVAIAGLRERAAHNRQLTTAANVRTAALVGVTVYLGFSIAGYLSVLVLSELQRGKADLSLLPGGEFAVVALLAATAVLGWVSRRRVIVLMGALPAAAAVCVAAPWGTGLLGATVTLLVCLAALTALAGAPEQPARRWLWLVGAVAAAQFLPVFGRYASARILLLVAVAGICMAWAVFDARPAIAIAMTFLLIMLPTAVDSAGAIVGSFVPFLGALGVIAALALWLLRSQSAQGQPPGRGA